MLSNRQKLILKAIVEEYVDSNEPVGSKLLTNKPYLKYSSATIRYDMQALEELGYLEKTHTSSGRAPSELGYRYYVDNLLIRDDRVKDSYDFINRILNNKQLNKEDKIKDIINFLSKETGCYIAMIGSSSYYARVKKMEIVPLTNNEALLLIVTNTGVVKSQKITIPKEFLMDDLLKIIAMFDVAMYDQGIFEIREILTREAMKPRLRQMVDFRDEVFNFLIKGFSAFMNNECFQAGMSQLIKHEEFKNIDTISKIIKVIDEDKLKEYMLETDHNLQVRIGSENLDIGLDDCSIITIPYYLDENEFGTLCLVGPKRMKYNRNIPLLEYVANNLPKIYK